MEEATSAAASRYSDAIQASLIDTTRLLAKAAVMVTILLSLAIALTLGRLEISSESAFLGVSIRPGPTFPLVASGVLVALYYLRALELCGQVRNLRSTIADLYAQSGFVHPSMIARPIYLFEYSSPLHVLTYRVSRDSPSRVRRIFAQGALLLGPLIGQIIVIVVLIQRDVQWQLTGINIGLATVSATAALRYASRILVPGAAVGVERGGEASS